MNGISERAWRPVAGRPETTWGGWEGASEGADGRGDVRDGGTIMRQDMDGR